MAIIFLSSWYVPMRYSTGIFSSRYRPATSRKAISRPYSQPQETSANFRLYAGAVKSPQVIDFLQALVQRIRKPLLLVWDRLPAHRSRLVRDYIDQLDGRIQVEYLPAYAPELNPVEYIWGYWKQHELPNVCPTAYWQLSEAARCTLRRMRRRPRLITAFWKQASLWTE